MNQNSLKKLLKILRKGGKRGKSRFNVLDEEKSNEVIKEFNQEVKKSIVDGYEIKCDIWDEDANNSKKCDGKLMGLFSVPGVTTEEDITVNFSESPTSNSATHKLFIQVDPNKLFGHKNREDADFLVEELSRDSGEFEKSIDLTFDDREPMPGKAVASFNGGGMLRFSMPYKVSQEKSESWNVDVIS